MLRPAILALALFLVAAPAAGARTVPGKSVHTRGFTISCFAVLPGAGGGIECTSRWVPDIGELDSYFALHRHGRARLSQRGDYPGYSVKSRRVDDGHRWTWKGVRCAFAGGGVRCVNRDGHGFVIAASGSRRF